MIKTFIIIVVLAGFNPITGGKDLMIFPQQFETSEACLDYARENKEPLFFKTWEFYGVKKIENIYCVDQDQLDKMNIKPQTKEDITPKVPDKNTPSTPLPDLPKEKNTLDWSDWNQSI